MEDSAIVETKGRSKKPILLILSILVFLGILAGGYFVFGRGVLNNILNKKNGSVVEKTGNSAPSESLFSKIMSSVKYPYFPADTESFLDDAKTFQMKAFQPIFKEFVDTDPNKMYLVVNYDDATSGDSKEAKIFLGGQISYTDKKTGEREVIDSIKLKDLLKPGGQFGIYYLSMIPADFSIGMPYCQPQGQAGQKAECLLAYFKQISDQNGENAFYPFFVYRVLKK